MKTSTFGPTKIPYLCLLMLLAVATTGAETFDGREIKTAGWNGYTIEYVDGHILVKHKAGVEESELNDLFQSLGITVARQFVGSQWLRVDAGVNGDIFGIITHLLESPLIECAEPNQIGHADYDPNDPDFRSGKQWALGYIPRNPPVDINVRGAWDITLGSPDITIGVLDTGIPLINGALSHPELDDPNRILLGSDVTNDLDGIVMDSSGHGTHVAGIIGAKTDNGIGVAGAAPLCKLYIVQVFTGNGTFAQEYFYDAIVDAVDHGARVINFSGGISAPSQFLEEGVMYAANATPPRIIVCSVGNNSTSSNCTYIRWPAAYSLRYDNVIAVGATTSGGLKAPYSNCGPQLNMMAPGGYPGCGGLGPGAIWSTFPGYIVRLIGTCPGTTYNYSYLSGTSMAAPHVTGAIGLMLSVDPSTSPATIRDRLQQTCVDMGPPGRDDETGWGRIDVFNAILAGPPSQPKGLSVAAVNGQWGYRHPYLTWRQAPEPDVVNGGNIVIERRIRNYGIWSAWSQIAQQPGDSTHFTDFGIGTAGYGSDLAEYRIRSRDASGQYSPYSRSVLIAISPDMFKVADNNRRGSNVFTLEQNFPNPFNPTTTIVFQIPNDGPVVLKVFDVLGRVVTTLVNEERRAGFYAETFDASQLPSGVYVYRLSFGSVAATKKLLLMK